MLVGMSTVKTQRDIRHEYQALMKPKTRWSKDIKAWIQKWENVMNRGLYYGMAFATDILT
jgi:hypothetical protein